MNVAVGFLAVGQGDCTIVVDRGTRAAIVVDCPSGRSALLVETLRALGVVRIDVAVITHSHMDHIGGMYEVINAFRTRQVRFNYADVAMNPGERSALRAMRLAYEGLEDRGIELRPANAGDSGRVGDIRWTALAPTHGQLAGAQARGDPNYGSVILRLEVGKLRVLIGGDADRSGWQKAMKRGEDLRADIFRLPHHGAALSILDQVLDAVGANYHVVSVGTLMKHHPALSTLEALGKRSDRARVMCTEVNRTCLGHVSRSTAERRAMNQNALHPSAGSSFPCAGNVMVEVRDDGWTVTPSVAVHGRVIAALGNPMCRLHSRAGLPRRTKAGESEQDEQGSRSTAQDKDPGNGSEQPTLWQ